MPVSTCNKVKQQSSLVSGERYLVRLDRMEDDTFMIRGCFYNAQADADGVWRFAEEPLTERARTYGSGRDYFDAMVHYYRRQAGI